MALKLGEERLMADDASVHAHVAMFQRPLSERRPRPQAGPEDLPQVDMPLGRGRLEAARLDALPSHADEILDS